MHQLPPGVDQGTPELLLQPWLETDALDKLDVRTRCAEGTSSRDPFQNHDAVNSDAGFFLKGTSPPNYPSFLDTFAWVRPPALEGWHDTPQPSTAGHAPGPG